MPSHGTRQTETRSVIPTCIRMAALLALLGVGCAPVMMNPVASAPDRRPVSASRDRRPDAPSLVRLKNGHYRVAQPWTVVLDGRVWQVQKGYRCNGITAPASVKREIGDGVNRPETWAAVFHDWLFTQPGMSRSRADALFYQLLTAYGVPPVKARLMYTAVTAYSTSKALR
jgi:hypothetical protein